MSSLVNFSMISVFFNQVFNKIQRVEVSYFDSKGGSKKPEYGNRKVLRISVQSLVLNVELYTKEKFTFSVILISFLMDKTMKDPHGHFVCRISHKSKVTSFI